MAAQSAASWLDDRVSSTTMARFSGRDS